MRSPNWRSRNLTRLRSMNAGHVLIWKLKKHTSWDSVNWSINRLMTQQIPLAFAIIPQVILLVSVKTMILVFCFQRNGILSNKAVGSGWWVLASLEFIYFLSVTYPYHSFYTACTSSCLRMSKFGNMYKGFIYKIFMILVKCHVVYEMLHLCIFIFWLRLAFVWSGPFWLHGT